MWHQFWHPQILHCAHIMYFCVLYGPQNKQQPLPYMLLIDFHNREGECLLRGTNWFFNWKRLLSVLRGLRSIAERSFVNLILLRWGKVWRYLNSHESVTLSGKVRPSIRPFILDAARSYQPYRESCLSAHM